MTEVIILAGGLGTRLRSIVDDRPKPMAEVAGRPFLEHLLIYSINQGIEHFIISIGYKGASIKEFFGYSFMGKPITYVVEDQPLGTGGGLLKSCKELNTKEPFVLMNGDTYFAVNLKDMIRFHKESDSELTVALFLATEPNRFGSVELGESAKLIGFNNSKAKINELANGGVYVVNPDLLNIKKYDVLPLSFEDQLLKRFLKQKKNMFGFKQSKRFIDIGLPKDYENAQLLKWHQRD